VTESKLSARARWCHALLVEEVSRGREAGYVPGDRLVPKCAPEAARAAIHDGITPMDVLRIRLELTATEEDALWLLACCELDPVLARLAEALSNTGMSELSVQHVLRLVRVGAAQIDRLAELGLIEVERDPRVPIHRRAIRIADRVLELARGELAPASAEGASSGMNIERVAIERVAIDPMLATIAERVLPCDAAYEIPPVIARAMQATEALLVLAIGPVGSDRELVLRAAHREPVLMIRCDQLAREPMELARQLRAIAREARLFQLVPLFAGADRLLGGDLALVLDKLPCSVFATASATGEGTFDRPLAIHTVMPPDAVARRALWTTHLVGATGEVIEACIDRYRLPTELLVQTARAVVASGRVEIDDVQLALRERLERKLAGLAQRVEWKQGWDDLVLPADQMELLTELIARVRHRRRVLSDWGFAAKIGKGIGVSALFSGPPGTGKTMIAGLVASELGMDLYQVDLSRIVSKYIGETEKQLSALFEAAEHGQAILLFDEADSLFAKRTEVKSSNDRYANLEVNYLLQRLESFEGMCLLTTNHESAIDEAFMRRLSMHVRVPMPDEEQRELLWRAMLPAAADVEPVDFFDLARTFTMSGGYIKNAVLRAAYLAAADASAITLSHFERAARAEYESMGKVAYQSVPKLRSL
jgi:hypothetical protein